MPTDVATRPQGGRPPLPPEQRRTHQAATRLTAPERRRLDRVLAERGVTESSLLRELLAPLLAGVDT